MHDHVSMMPSLFTFKPLWFAKYPVSQTIIAELWHHSKCYDLADYFTRIFRFLRRSPPYVPQATRSHHHRQFILSNDMQPLAIDWINEEATDPRAVIIINPGMNGDIESFYVLPWFSISREKNYVVAMLNRRGCIKERPMTIKATRFCSYTDNMDMNQVYKMIDRMYPNVPKIGVGYSAGGNHIAKSLTLPNLPLDAAVIISCANDIMRSYDYLKHDPLFDGILSRGVRQIAETHGHIPIYRGIESMKRLTEIDATVAIRLGYEGVDDYYKAQSSHEELACTSIPTLCIVSKDDFMLGTTASLYAEVAKKNENIIAVITEQGGHMGWLQDDMKSWMDSVVTEFIEARHVIRQCGR